MIHRLLILQLVFFLVKVIRPSTSRLLIFTSVEYGAAAERRFEEAATVVAVDVDDDEARRHDRQREEQQDGRDERRPAEHRHAHERQARRAHPEDRGDEVDRADAIELKPRMTRPTRSRSIPVSGCCTESGV